MPLLQGGAEFHAESLAAALVAAGHEVDTVRIPDETYTPEQAMAGIRFCRQLDLSFCAGKKIDRLIGLKFPAYLVNHPEKVQWILHQARYLYDLWDSPDPRISRDSEWLGVRDAVHRIDTECIPQARSVFANSLNVVNRLRLYNGVDAKPLYHPPPLAEKYYSEAAQEYLFLPSRIEDLKRQDLVLEALALTKRPISVVFAGTVSSPKFNIYIRQRALELNLNGRCKWLGWVSQEEKIRLYAQCLAVVYPPYDEDLG